MKLPAGPGNMTSCLTALLLVLTALFCANNVYSSTAGKIPVSLWSTFYLAPVGFVFGVSCVVITATVYWKKVAGMLASVLLGKVEKREMPALNPSGSSTRHRRGQSTRGSGRGRHKTELQASFTAKPSPKARRWRKHERRADSQASIPAYVAPKTTFDHGCGTLFKAASSLVRVLAAACLFPVVWAGQLAARVYFVCLHKLPGYKSERLAAAVELAARDAEIAAVCAFAQSAQSALSAAQKSLHAETSKRQALQQELDTSAQQFKQLLRDQQQQHQAAMHATKEAAAAVVSAAEEQSAMAAAAAAAARSSQASLLAEGTIHLQQLKDCQQQVLAMQQAYRTLQEAHCQLVRSEQAAKQKADEAEEEVQHVMQERLQDLHAAQEQVDKAKATAKDAEVAAQKADLAAQQTEARMVEQLLPVYNAEEQAQLVGSGCDGTVEVALNATFREHVYKWATNMDLDREARNLLVLRGPHVVQCYGLCQDNPTAPQPRHSGRRGLVMEWIPHTLYNLLVDASKIKSDWSLKDAVDIGLQTASGLASIHARGYVHGDLKSDNIGLTSHFGGLLVKLLDFGRAEEFHNRTLTWRSNMPLVAMYAPPEYAQVRLSGGTQYQLRPSVEVFVFGVMMGQLVDYYLWDGASPPEGEYLKKLATGQYQLPCQTSGHFFCQQEVPYVLKVLISQCVMHDPDQRPSMEFVTECLQAIKDKL